MLVALADGAWVQGSQPGLSSCQCAAQLSSAVDPEFGVRVRQVACDSLERHVHLVRACATGASPSPTQSTASVLGDRSHMQFADDGSLTTSVQSDAPGDAKTANWLLAAGTSGGQIRSRAAVVRPRNRPRRTVQGCRPRRTVQGCAVMGLRRNSYGSDFKCLGPSLVSDTRQVAAQAIQLPRLRHFATRQAIPNPVATATPSATNRVGLDTPAG